MVFRFTGTNTQVPGVLFYSELQDHGRVCFLGTDEQALVAYFTIRRSGCFADILREEAREPFQSNRVALYHEG